MLYKFIKHLYNIYLFIRKMTQLNNILVAFLKIDVDITSDDDPLIFSRIYSITSNI